MTSDGTSEDLKYNALFSNPRTASHLLTRLLNLPNQPAVHRHPDDGYIFMRPTLMRLKRWLGGKPVSCWTVHDQKSIQYAFQRSHDDLARWRCVAQANGKGAYLKFHCVDLVEPISETRWLHGVESAQGMQPWTVSTARNSYDGCNSSFRSEGNETCFPDSILKSWNPTFLIRHPALVLPSLVRADLDVGNDFLLSAESDAETQGYRTAWEDAKKWQVTFHWQRQLLEWYLAHLSDEEKHTGEEHVSYPIVLDADDIQSPSAHELLEKYTRAVGLDPNVVEFQWSAAPKREVEEMNIYEKRLLDTISASTGIVPGKTANGLVLEDEKIKWMTEFGKDLGAKLGVWVDEAMEDYERMREVRLKV
ncbi:hypothetical protein BDV96DRAFT_644877 [Lophiotrema nucula]|uniref:Uncharacterized protein n=1 Tax=Lophiotrema nucula TaxID=690887 RepID=A0A6A5ZGC1_9PLEO|nr:hypothetical protein BDV96DRAFT_644877 [Lophiotrema nucula]